jgi:hypothetical protein
MPLPAVAGTLQRDIDPSTWGLTNGTALTFANSGLTPVNASPIFRANVFDPGMPSGPPAIQCVFGSSGFSIPRPVQDDFSLYAVIKDPFTNVLGSQFWNNGSLIDGEASDGALSAGTGNPDTTGLGTHNVSVGTHILSVIRTKATGTFKVYVDGALDISITNNTNSLTAQANLFFGRGTSQGTTGVFYGRFLAYDAAHGAVDQVAVESYLTTTYGEQNWLRATKAVTYVDLGAPQTLHATKAVTYVDLGPPLTLTCTKAVTYIVTGPDDGTRQRLTVRYVRSHL